MTVTVEGHRSIHYAAPARIVDDTREMAWAEGVVSAAKGPDVKFIVGNYVQASTDEHPRFNSNGHEFPLEDLRKSITAIPHRPINLLHIPGRRIGSLAAAEFVYPMGESAVEAEPPIVEVLGALWSYYEPDLLPSVEMAYKEGSLYLSMEAVPKELTCKGKGADPGCGKTFAYDGRLSDTYCECLRKPVARKRLHSPMFTASALVIPPTRPGWRGASVTEISALVHDQIEEAERLYADLAADTPHLGPKEWESMTAWFLAAMTD